MPRSMIYDNIVQTISNTPLVRLNRVTPPGHATVLVKLEFFNPLSSVKDRIARAMIQTAEKSGVLDKDTRIIEPTSGNTGISLAFVAAAKGYRLSLVMPESIGGQRRALLRALGAELVLTPAQYGMRGAVAKAEELAATLPRAWMPQQFDNPANPAAHEATTGPEIWEDTQGRLDIFVAGVGTGGTITGVTRFLRSRNSGIRAVAVEPATSAVISGREPGRHGIQGIGAGFIPKNLDPSLLDSIETVTDEEAFHWARRLAREEGILCGLSSGANVAVAARLAARSENRGKVIVTIAASCAEDYLSAPVLQSETKPPATAPSGRPCTPGGKRRRVHNGRARNGTHASLRGNGVLLPKKA